MTAAEVAARLAGRREGRGWRCRCPLHGGHSLIVSDGCTGLLVTCWAGCDRLDVLTELRHLGVDGASSSALAVADDRHERRIIGAQRLWDAARDARRSPVVIYLRSRGITIPPPATLRWLPTCPHPNGVRLPAMVARVENVDRELIGIHRTFLRPDGTGKATLEPVKASLGPIAGGCVRLAPVSPGGWLVIAEGLETALSVEQGTGLPAWSALSAGGLERLILPSGARRVVIAADHDQSGVGERAARNAGQRWLSEGREVRLTLPDKPGADFNDLLLGGGI
jgi:putative DNA primase/helicase